MKQSLKICLLTLAACCLLGLGLIQSAPAKAANSYLPHWEHIPDGEPRLFEDPDNPGKMRVYIYGSHDTRKDAYCGYDLVTWSAPVENLNDWRYEGKIFESIVDGEADVLYAPDVVETKDATGKKTYYLYPNNRTGVRSGMIAKSDRPTGPFEVCNWKEGSTTQTNGILGFDPAVLVDDDGRVYGYWGFNSSNMAELDPNTMCTVKEGCKILGEKETGIDGTAENNEGDTFRFFEASSIRKVEKNKYVFVYSRKTNDNEFGLGPSNCTLAYAYSDSPLGPWTYGGTVVDSRARETDQDGKPICALQSWGNTHGSILEINGQWYVFYHRCINNSMYSRQATVEPINVTVTTDGKVEITEAEVTSQGFEINGLNPYKMQTAGSACFLTGDSYAPYIQAHYDTDYPGSTVVNISNNSIVGFKYLNFDAGKGTRDYDTLAVELIPKGKEGTIDIMLDRPWESSGGTKIGSLEVSSNGNGEETILTADIDGLSDIKGKHALYFVFKCSRSGSFCDLKAFQFGDTTVTDEDEGQDYVEPEPPATAAPDPSEAPDSTAAPGSSAAPDPSAGPAATTPPSAAPAASTAPTPTIDPGSASPETPSMQKGSIVSSGSFTYKVTSFDTTKGTVTLIKTNNKNAKNIQIPDAVSINDTRFLVTAIDKSAFKGCKKATKLTIGKNVAQIGAQAFQSCSKLKTITIRSAVLKKVGKNAFTGISAKAKISVPKKVLSQYKKLLKPAQGIKKTMKLK